MKNLFSVNDDFVNSRLDRWFRRQVSDVPQSLIEKNLRKGNIKVNNKKTKSSYKLRFNDLVIIKNINFMKDNIKEVKKKTIYRQRKIYLYHQTYLSKIMKILL